MLKQTIIATRLLLVLTLLCGVAYPLLVTGVAQAAFSDKAEGSLIHDAKGQAIGSALVAQKFRGDGYFWPRPSAGDYGTVASGASNKGPTSADLKKAIDERRETLKATAALAGMPIPAEMLFASGSGLDPHLSKQAARFQVERIARARRFDSNKKASLYALIERSTEGRQFALWGEERVNVLKLNLALDAL